ncbi:MAG TPA: hypothetical protein PLU35_14020, partial [Phycisphaerales bacterium]|nr:hypothetical protein [Phycisphaerales bacterium]
PVDFPRITNQVGGGDWIADIFGRGAEAAGYDVLDPEDFSGREKLAYNVNRFGTSAGVGALGLSRAAVARVAASQAGQRAAPAFGDAFLQPYSGPNVARTISGDVAAGAGSGAGLTLGEEYFPDNEWAQFFATLAGGVGGGFAGAAAHKPGDVARSLSRFAPDPDIPYAEGQMLPTSKRVADTAARVVQSQTTDPAAASARIGERAAAARLHGEPVPTAGLASDDIGLIGLERGLRQQPSADNPALRRQFLERDQALKEGAADAVGRLVDPDADLQAGLATAKARPDQIAAERDAAALPILRQAEASGATIDAQPVADTIDAMLATSKRPAVVNALRDARKMLNAPGTEDLDTTVSGLYETRKAINDLIEGRSDNATGRYAKKELIEVRDALDAAITQQVPEFGQYLDTYRQGSRALDVFDESKSVSRLVDSDTDLRNTAKRLLTGGEYGRDQAMREVQGVMSSDPEAARAWRAAVAEVLSDQVSSRAKDGELSMAQVRRVWDDHRDTLAQVFSPEDMQTLERTHEMLAPLGNLSQQTVPGSATVDNARLAGMVEAAVLAGTGNAITTGMIMKRLRVAANLIPGFREVSMPYKTARLIERMMFDPELARVILERPIDEGVGALWNSKLQSALAEGELSRGLYSDDDEDDELRRAVDGD